VTSSSTATIAGGDGEERGVGALEHRRDVGEERRAAGDLHDKARGHIGFGRLADPDRVGHLEDLGRGVDEHRHERDGAVLGVGDLRRRAGHAERRDAAGDRVDRGLVGVAERGAILAAHDDERGCHALLGQGVLAQLGLGRLVRRRQAGRHEPLDLVGRRDGEDRAHDDEHAEQEQQRAPSGCELAGRDVH